MGHLDVVGLPLAHSPKRAYKGSLHLDETLKGAWTGVGEDLQEHLAEFSPSTGSRVGNGRPGRTQVRAGLGLAARLLIHGAFIKERQNPN